MSGGPVTNLKLVGKDEQTDTQSNANAPPSSGGGGGGPDDMELRVAALEKGMDEVRISLKDLRDGQQKAALESAKQAGDVNTKLAEIIAKLDAKATKADLTPIETKLTSVKDAIDTRAPLADLNLIKGRVESLPTTTQLVLFAVAIFAAAGITRLFGH